MSGDRKMETVKWECAIQYSVSGLVDVAQKLHCENCDSNNPLIYCNITEVYISLSRNISTIHANITGSQKSLFIFSCLSSAFVLWCNEKGIKS